MNPDILISFQNVGFSYKVRKGFFRFLDHEILKNISFDIKRGETLGIIGQNGAGKSTILRLIAGIIRSNSGRIRYNGKPSVSLLTLQAGFDPELSGRTNIILGGMLLGFSKKEINRNINTIIEFSELDGYIDQPIKTYSTGMRARLGFALALELSPDVLLVDEVLGVGDITFRKKASKVMKDKMRSEQTVVFVSHDMKTITQLCNRVVWIENGKIAMLDAANDVVNTYIAHINKGKFKQVVTHA